MSSNSEQIIFVLPSIVTILYLGFLICILWLQTWEFKILRLISKSQYGLQTSISTERSQVGYVDPQLAHAHWSDRRYLERQSIILIRIRDG